MLFETNYPFDFVRVDDDDDSMGVGTLVSNPHPTEADTQRHEYFTRPLTYGATKVTFTLGITPTLPFASVAWERPFVDEDYTEQELADALADYFATFYKEEIDGQTIPGLNLHEVQVDPGTHNIMRDNGMIGWVDIFDYPYGTRVLTVEHYYLFNTAGDPVLPNNKVLDVLKQGAAPGDALTPRPRTGVSYREHIVVVTV